MSACVPPLRACMTGDKLRLLSYEVLRSRGGGGGAGGAPATDFEPPRSPLAPGEGAPAGGPGAPLAFRVSPDGARVEWCDPHGGARRGWVPVVNVAGVTCLPPTPSQWRSRGPGGSDGEEESGGEDAGGGGRYTFELSVAVARGGWLALTLEAPRRGVGERWIAVLGSLRAVRAQAALAARARAAAGAWHTAPIGAPL